MNSLNSRAPVLEEVVQSLSFRRGLARTARLARKGNCRASLIVYCELQDARCRRIHAEPAAGSEDMDGLPWAAVRAGCLRDHSSVSKALIVYLGSQMVTNPVVPSRDEMCRAMPNSERTPACPTVAVGAVDACGQGALLCFRYQVEDPGVMKWGLAPEDMNSRARAVSYLWPKDEYARAIEEPGFFRAAVLRFALDKRSDYVIVENADSLHWLERP